MVGDNGPWDPNRDPARLASVMQRSGYSADQVARLIGEVAAAEAIEAERRGLPGLGKIRGTVSRQTVERWAKGASVPKGWWARFALIVVERLEQTLESGFDVRQGGSDEGGTEPDFDTTGQWRAQLLPWAIVAVLVTLFLVASALSGGEPDPGGETMAGATAAGLFPMGATVANAPPVANDDPNRPRGAGCDPSPAVPWWASTDSPPLPDGHWFGRAMQVEAGVDGGHRMIFDIACFYSGRFGVTLDPGSPSLENDGAVSLGVPAGVAVHWPDGSGAHVETDVERWLDHGDDAAVPCPGGPCSAWIDVVGGVAVEIVVVDFAAD